MNLPKQVTEFQTAAREAIEPIAKTSFESFEKLAALNSKVISEAMASSVTKAKAILTAKDPKAALSMMYNPQALNDSVAYLQQVMTIAKDNGAAMTKLIEKQVAEGTKMVNGAFDSLASKAPAGTETMIAMMKSSMSAANSAFERANTATKAAVEKAVEQVESNVSSASKKVAAAVKATA